METSESEKQNMNSNVTVSESDGKSLLENSEIDSFYQRLNKLHTSSGLNLVFDLRQSMLDLHLCYKEVTARGGFLQDSQPLLNLYALVLYQYEKLYYALVLNHEDSGGFNFGNLNTKEVVCEVVEGDITLTQLLIQFQDKLMNEGDMENADFFF